MQDRVAQAAARLFSEKGFAATGIRDLGRELGMTSVCLAEYLRGAAARLASEPTPPTR